MWNTWSLLGMHVRTTSKILDMEKSLLSNDYVFLPAGSEGVICTMHGYKYVVVKFADGGWADYTQDLFEPVENSDGFVIFDE